MKKLFIVATVLSVALFSGCSNSEIETLKQENAELQSKLAQYENDSISENTTENLQSKAIQPNNIVKTEQYELTKYVYRVNSNQIYSPSTNAIVILKNLTNDTIAANLDLSLKDKNNQIVGIKSVFDSNISPNQESVMWTFDNKEFVDFECNISISKKDATNEYAQPIANILKIEDKALDDRIIITATNTGTQKINFLSCNVLYFKDNNLVYHDTPNIGNSEFGLNPSESSSAESLIYDIDYDYYKIYTSGY